MPWVGSWFSQKILRSCSYVIFDGSKTTRTDSACPVLPVPDSWYVGFGVEPPWYPTAVVQTPGCSQNVFSSPQKQPSANSATWKPSGYGPAIGVPRIVWMPGVMIGSLRPGRASAAVGILSGLRNENIRTRCSFELESGCPNSTPDP